MSKTDYKAKLSGSTTGAKTGMMYRYDAGDVITAPKGEFKHDATLVEVKAGKKAEKKSSSDDDKSGVPNDESTVKEIKAYLDERGVEYAARATKDELLALVEEV